MLVHRKSPLAGRRDGLSMQMESKGRMVREWLWRWRWIWIWVELDVDVMCLFGFVWWCAQPFDACVHEAAVVGV